MNRTITPAPRLQLPIAAFPPDFQRGVDTQKRTPKQGAHWFRDLTRR